MGSLCLVKEACHWTPPLSVPRKMLIKVCHLTCHCVAFLPGEGPSKVPSFIDLVFEAVEGGRHLKMSL